MERRVDLKERELRDAEAPRALACRLHHCLSHRNPGLRPLARLEFGGDQQLLTKRVLPDEFAQYLLREAAAVGLSRVEEPNAGNHIGSNRGGAYVVQRRAMPRFKLIFPSTRGHRLGSRSIN